jgi:hypothetical protein
MRLSLIPCSVFISILKCNMNDKKNIKTLNKAVSPEISEKINKKLAKKHFHYEKEGELFSFDYMIQILPETKKMMSVGSWYEYNLISVTIFNLNDMFKKLFGMVKNSLDENNGVYNVTEYIERLYLFEMRNKIHSYLEMININRIIIDQYLVYSSELEIEEPKIEENIIKKPINEGMIDRLAVRTVVKDIVTIIKQNNEGGFYLPEDVNDELEYTLTNKNVSFSVELTLRFNDIIGGFGVNGAYSHGDDVIEIVVEYNPNTIKSQLYDLIGELNEVVTHEMVHLNQNYKGELHYPDLNDGPLEYYTRKHEIPAQHYGFKRLSKLRNLPFEDVVREWFRTHKKIHKLKPEEEEIVIDKILNYNK